MSSCPLRYADLRSAGGKSNATVLWEVGVWSVGMCIKGRGFTSGKRISRGMTWGSVVTLASHPHQQFVLCVVMRDLDSPFPFRSYYTVIVCLTFSCSHLVSCLVYSPHR